MATTATNLTDQWQQISAVACLTTVETGSVHIHVADAAVAGDADVAFHTLSGVGSSFNLQTDRRLFARRANSNERASVSVTANVAP